MHREWKAKLSPAEREKFEHLTTESESDAFRILRNWSQTDSPDFYASCESLSHRLGISVRGASKLRRKFYKIGILWPMAPYVPNKFCPRFKWIAGEEPKRQQAALIAPEQWKGDPSDARLTERRQR
ncbi:MAG: hypothetical protein DMF05_06315 [Verrucomicrobia bacterium]|nr:MAG: hypothetical protein DMF05_06315 [Verrucomicrobiota bacterium]